MVGAYKNRGGTYLPGFYCQRLLLVHQRPQHVLEDPSVAVVVGLTRGVDPDYGVEVDLGAVLLTGGALTVFRGGAAVEGAEAGVVEGFSAVQAEGAGALALVDFRR